ncbi:MAG: pentapeptide repeat-containing protein [Balneolaceae bacterium]
MWKFIAFSSIFHDGCYFNFSTFSVSLFSAKPADFSLTLYSFTGSSFTGSSFTGSSFTGSSLKGSFFVRVDVVGDWAQRAFCTAGGQLSSLRSAGFECL